MDNEERRNQIVNQHRAASALARSLADLFEEKAWAINTGGLDALAGVHGRDSLAAMEQLGDWLNNMDAADPELAKRLDPIFRRGQAEFGANAS